MWPATWRPSPAADGGSAPSTPTRRGGTSRDRTQRSWQELARGRHSTKSERVQTLIERVSPGPYLELFGRRPADGWVVFGDTIERCLFDLDIPDLGGG